MMSVISSRIKLRRKLLKLSQEELALKVGVTQRQISFYETGKNNPTSGVLMVLADALNTTTDYLLGRTDIPDKPARGEGDLDELELDVIRILRSNDTETKKRIVNAIKALSG